MNYMKRHINLRKAYTLVEMLVALAVGAIVVMATYASYEMVNTQYQKNTDIANMHTSGRAIMQMIERDVRMAGFEYRHTSGANKGKKAFGSKITKPLDITDSGNKCCDEVTVIYDYYDEEAKKAERIRVRYWAENYSSNKGSRYRLYKQKDILGENKKILAKPKPGNKEVMADYIEDLQISNIIVNSSLFSGDEYRDNIEILDINEKSRKQPDGWITGTAKTGCLASSKNGLLFSGSNNYEGITIYDPKNNKKGRIGYIDTGIRKTSDLAVDNNGLIYQSSPNEKTIFIYDPSTKKQVGSIHADFQKINALAIDSSNLLYVGGKVNTEIHVFNTATKSKIKVIKLRNQHPNGRVFPWKMVVDNGLLYVSNRNDYKITIHRIDSGKYAGYIPTNPIRGDIVIGPDGNLYGGRWQQQGIDIYNKMTAQHIGYIPTKNRVYSLAFLNEKSGKESLVAVNLILRTKNQYGKDRQFKKKDYHSGNFKLDKTDKYKRDTFSTTVLVRNLAL